MVEKPFIYLSPENRINPNSSLFCIETWDGYEWSGAEFYPEELILMMEHGRKFVRDWNRWLKDDGEQPITRKFALKLLQDAFELHRREKREPVLFVKQTNLTTA